ncbi:unnamed protein product [Fusarium venenatum]|uniref:Uncharacterized protein n=1 Tax=Fusarium venenatum TaxID=56646 RepID=A0A2L2TAD6_9HYPO|nr:uncharacterized protein FVRRES_05723 [Fusarium venenatum]CEI61287.1 unnamed protein product [Fusarium venenatum]
MNFGGPDGTWLPLLFQISVFTSETTHAPRGLAFYYKDGSCKLYWFRADKAYFRGRRSVVRELGFPLNGPGGERNTAVITNFARVLKMQQDDRKRGDSMRSSTQNLLIQSREVPDGQTIIGILASVELLLGSGRIETLGISCNPLTSNLVFKADGPREGLLAKNKPQWERTTNPDFGYPSITTMVCLERVRRTRMYTAACLRNLLRKYISGLCFEVWDLTPPVYMGRRSTAVDWLLLSPEDGIEHIKFWRYHGSKSQDRGSQQLKFTGTNLTWTPSTTGNTATVEKRPSDPARGRLVSCLGLKTPCTNEFLFWEIRDSKAKIQTVTHIHAYFYFEGQCLCGFEFCYGDKFSSCVGLTSGIKASAVIGQNERVTCLEIKTSRSHWRPIIEEKFDKVVFHANTGREVTLSASGCGVGSLVAPKSLYGNIKAASSKTETLSRGGGGNPRIQEITPSTAPECPWHKALWDDNKAAELGIWWRRLNHTSQSICLPSHVQQREPSVGIFVEVAKWPTRRSSPGQLLVQDAGPIFVVPYQ